ncbi:hypothetical protein [Aliiruegeria lutimaris]|nr:hypothetical protein [Aliiruegeria lutimaris]
MNRKTTFFAATVAALALTGLSQAQTAGDASETLAPQAAASETAQPVIAPRQPIAGTSRAAGADSYGGGNRYGHREGHRKGRDHDHDGFRLLGWNWHWDWDDDDDDDDRGRNYRGSVQNPATSGSTTPPANGLFNNGAAPKAQVK